MIKSGSIYLEYRNDQQRSPIEKIYVYHAGIAGKAVTLIILGEYFHLLPSQVADFLNAEAIDARRISYRFEEKLAICFKEELTMENGRYCFIGINRDRCAYSPLMTFETFKSSYDAYIADYVACHKAEDDSEDRDCGSREIESRDDKDCFVM